MGVAWLKVFRDGVQRKSVDETISNPIPEDFVEALRSDDFREDAMTLRQCTGSYADIHNWENLYLAYRKAAKGKRGRQASEDGWVWSRRFAGRLQARFG